MLLGLRTRSASANSPLPLVNGSPDKGNAMPQTTAGYVLTLERYLNEVTPSR